MKKYIFPYFVFLFFLLLFTYHGVFNNFFLSEDGNWLYRAVLLQKQPSTFWEPHGGRFRSFVILLFLTEFKMFGYNPAGYYAVNFFFHWVNSLLVFFLAEKILAGYFHEGQIHYRAAAFTASFLFAVQAMNCVPVLWISLIHDILNATFYLLSILCFFSFCEARSFYMAFFSYVCFLLSVAMKEVAVSLPFIFLLIQVMFMKQKSRSLNAFVLLCVLTDVLIYKSYGSKTQFTTLSGFMSGSLLIAGHHVAEACRALFGFSQNKTLWLEPYFSHLFLRKMSLSHAALGFSLIFFLSVYLAGIKERTEDKATQKAFFKIFLFGALWMVVTFSPHVALRYLLLWQWVAFSPGYHYFYLSTAGLSLSTGIVLSACTGHGNFRKKGIKTLSLLFLLFALFLNNFFPIRHMERVYGYHADTLKYLLNRVQAVFPRKERAKLVLVNFPSQYMSLHFSSMPYFLQFFNIPVTPENIYWMDEAELKSYKKNIFSPETSATILFYASPFDIQDKTKTVTNKFQEETGKPVK